MAVVPGYYVFTAIERSLITSNAPTAAAILAALRPVGLYYSSWVGPAPRVTRRLNPSALRPNVTQVTWLVRSTTTLPSLSTYATGAQSTLMLALARLGNFTDVAFTAYDPDVNGAVAWWESGAAASSSATRDAFAQDDYAAHGTAWTAAPDNPVGPTTRADHAATIAERFGDVADAAVAGAHAVAAGAGTLAHDAVTGAGGLARDAASGVNEAARAAIQRAREASDAANAAARDAAKTAALWGVGIVGFLGGVAWLIGRSTGRSAATVAGDSLATAFSVTPAGRAVGMARNPSAMFGRSSATTSKALGGKHGTLAASRALMKRLPRGTDGTSWAALVDDDGGVLEFLRGGLYGYTPARPTPRELAAAQAAAGRLRAAAP